MKTASVDDLKAHLSEYLRASANGPVVVTRNGKPVAALVAVTDDEELERLLMAQSPKLQAILDAARRQIAAGEGIPHDEFWKQVEADNAAAQRRPKRRKGTRAR